MAGRSNIEGNFFQVFSLQASFSEPAFVNLLWGPGIDSQPGGPTTLFVVRARQATYRLAESIPRNIFLGSLIVYKYGLSSDSGAFRNLFSAAESICLKVVFSLSLGLGAECFRAGHCPTWVVTWPGQFFILHILKDFVALYTNLHALPNYHLLFILFLGLRRD